MKIGILTTYFATNFGAMLQPFAMKRTLEQMGHEAEMIRYRQPKVWWAYNPWSKDKFLRSNVMAIIFHILTLPLQLWKKRKFYRYMHKHVEPCGGFVKEIDAQKDAYIFGSDQIWNPSVTGGFDRNYFGDFKTKNGARKIAYAASAEDIKYTQENIAFLKKHLEGLDAIGVRESQLAENLMRETGEKRIHTVVDPTVLADPEIYNEVKQRNPLPGKKYVLFYKIRKSEDFMPKVLDYARSIGAEMLILSTWIEWPIIKIAMRNDDVHYHPTASVEDFLGAVRNAECTFTPSFHGCVFPVLFHKPFFSLVVGDKWNVRASDWLDRIGLADRLLTIDQEINNREIDFCEVDKRVNDLRKASRDFLAASLS